MAKSERNQESKEPDEEGEGSQHRLLPITTYLAKHTFRGINKLPAQSMFGRRTKTLLHTAHSLLKPGIIEGVGKKLWERTDDKILQQTRKGAATNQEGNIIRATPKPGDSRRRWYGGVRVCVRACVCTCTCRGWCH